MTNKHASKQHGLVGNIHPKSKNIKRLNKDGARARKAEFVTAQNERLTAAGYL